MRKNTSRQRISKHDASVAARKLSRYAAQKRSRSNRKLKRERLRIGLGAPRALRRQDMQKKRTQRKYGGGLRWHESRGLF